MNNPEILRAMLGMLVKQRSYTWVQTLDIDQGQVRRFADKYNVGITVDNVAGTYVITIQERGRSPNAEETMLPLPSQVRAEAIPQRHE